MKKPKNYLVYDGEEGNVEPGSLREMFEKETTKTEEVKETPVPPTKIDTPNKEKTKKPKNKKAIEKFLIGLIVVVIVLMAGTIALFFLGNDNTIINVPITEGGRIETNIVSNPTAKQTFGYISRNNQAIVTYFEDVRNLLLENPDDFDAKIDGYKKEVVEDIDTFSSYRQIYLRYNGESLHDIYIERVLNAFDLIKSVESAPNRDKAIEDANRFINKERELNTRSIAALIVWLERNELEYDKIGDAITLK